MRKNVIVFIEAIIFSVFWVFGTYINKNGVINFQDTIMYLQILEFCVLFFICITLLYKLLEKLEEKQDKNNNIKINIKKYIIIAAIIFVCWIPVFLAVFPGYYCYDVSYQYLQFCNGRFTTHVPIIHTILLSGLIKGIYLLTNSYNLGIAIYTILQMILASIVFSYTIYFLEKYNVSKIIRIIGILYYCFFPVVHMFVLNSSKDTLFTLIMILLILYLIDIFKYNEEFFTKKKAIIKYFCLVLLFCFLRNNGIYIIIGVTITSLFLLSSKIKFKFLIINVSAIILYLYLFFCIIAMPNIYKGSSAEMFSVPAQQIAYVYKNSNSKLTKEEKEIIESMYNEDSLKFYIPELADPVKNNFKVEVFKENINFYIKLGFNYKSEYVNAFLLNTVGYWFPNQIINGYNKTGNGIYANRKTSYFAGIVEYPGTKESFIPELDEIYYKLSSEGIVENIPIVSLFFSIGANFWLVCLILGYSFYKKRYSIIFALFIIIFTWLTMMFGPIVLVRYMLILFFGFPLNIALLFNNNKFEEQL